MSDASKTEDSEEEEYKEPVKEQDNNPPSAVKPTAASENTDIKSSPTPNPTSTPKPSLTVTPTPMPEGYGVGFLISEIPDEVLQKYLVQFDVNNDGRLYDEEIEKITEIKINGGVKNLKRLCVLTSVTKLEIVNCPQLTNISSLGESCWFDGSQFIDDDFFGEYAGDVDYIFLNGLTSLNLSGCGITEYQGFCQTNGNPDADLCLSKCPNLTVINYAGPYPGCGEKMNTLSNRVLDFSDCPKLETVTVCDAFGIKSINLSNCSSLTTLILDDCSVGEINITNCTSLTTIQVPDGTVIIR